jgi:hypothetical protein
MAALFALVHAEAENSGMEAETLLALEACRDLGDPKAQKLIEEGRFSLAVWTKEAGEQVKALKLLEAIITEGGRFSAKAKAEIREIYKDATGEDLALYEPKELAAITAAYQRLAA